MPIFKNSRYTTARKRKIGGKKEIGIRERLVFDSDKCDLYELRQGDRLDLIADRYYGDAQLWWVIMDANPEYDFEFEIPYGAELKIPAHRDVRRKLNA